jgi:hypothetical protein
MNSLFHQVDYGRKELDDLSMEFSLTFACSSFPFLVKFPRKRGNLVTVALKEMGASILVEVVVAEDGGCSPKML